MQIYGVDFYIQILFCQQRYSQIIETVHFFMLAGRLGVFYS